MGQLWLMESGWSETESKLVEFQRFTLKNVRAATVTDGLS